MAEASEGIHSDHTCAFIVLDLDYDSMKEFFEPKCFKLNGELHVYYWTGIMLLF